jgi:hypothetical protein
LESIKTTTARKTGQSFFGEVIAAVFRMQSLIRHCSRRARTFAALDQTNTPRRWNRSMSAMSLATSLSTTRRIAIFHRCHSNSASSNANAKVSHHDNQSPNHQHTI